WSGHGRRPRRGRPAHARFRRQEAGVEAGRWGAEDGPGQARPDRWLDHRDGRGRAAARRSADHRDHRGQGGAPTADRSVLMSEAPPLIAMRGIERTYVMGDNLVHALRGVDLTIQPGEAVAIMGTSGS